jgi:hypothetical protein
MYSKKKKKEEPFRYFSKITYITNAGVGACEDCGGEGYKYAFEDGRGNITDRKRLCRSCVEKYRKQVYYCRYFSDTSKG